MHKSIIYKILFHSIICLIFIFILNDILYSEDLYPFVQKNRVGYINQNGEIVIKPKFETKIRLSYNLYQGKYYPFYDLPKNAFFSEGKATFRKSWKILFIKLGYDFGVVDTLGNIVIPAQETEFGSFHCNRSQIMVYNNKYLFIEAGYTFADITGKIFNNSLPIFSYVDDFSDNIASVLEYNLYNYIDTSGKFIIDGGFENAGRFNNGTAPVMIDSLWAIIDKSGNLIIQPKYLKIWSKYNGFFRVYDGKNYSFINDKEINLFKNSFRKADDFSEGFAAVEFGEFDYGFIDTLGNTAFKFDNCNGIGSFNSGLARIQIGEKWGYINTEGEFVIQPHYDYAINFNDNFALVWEGNNVFIINTKGKHIWQYFFGEKNEKN